MAYLLSAVVADATLLRERTAGLDHAVIATLRQEMALLPVTHLLVQELTGALADFTVGELCADQPFRLVLSTPLSVELAEWSRQGPVAYLEATLDDDSAYQSAVVWQHACPAWGPAFDDGFTGPRAQWPLNAALARLGVLPGERDDLFAEVGLDVERDPDGWLAYGRRRLTPNYYDALVDEWERQHADRPGTDRSAARGRQAAPDGATPAP
jgi:hypothetical protein